jgi:hypothetical protein
LAKKVIAFDLDGTLAPSKSPLPDRMSVALSRLLDLYDVCVTSGGKFEQFEKQLLANLKAKPNQLTRLHLMPTCGTRYYKFDLNKNAWQKVYAEDFTDAQKKEIITVLEAALDELGYRESKPYGEIIEDRGSQITLSALGQDIVDELGDEGVRLKEAWDPDNAKKNRIREYAAPKLPKFEVRVGGLTSVDITKPGIDKAYGMEKLMDILHATKDEILFIGDRLAEGGNDYPVKAMGIDSLEVSRWQETALIIEAITWVAE